MRELLVRTGTGIALVVLFVGSILLGPHTMFLMMLLIYFLGSRELLRAGSSSSIRTCYLQLLAGALLIGASYGHVQYGLGPIWLGLPFLIWLLGHGIHSGNKSLLIFFWLALPLSAFIGLAGFSEKGFSSLFPVSVIGLVWISDTFSYLSGRLFGKHAFTPRLSPGKTWEGFLGGVFLTTLSGWLFFRFAGSYSLPTWIISAFLVSLLGVAGDLFESQLKRNYGLKDMGNILPGHGGVLDRFDSLFFVAPAVFLLLLIQDLLA